jgi:hypothetical protein
MFVDQILNESFEIIPGGIVLLPVSVKPWFVVIFLQVF